MRRVALDQIPKVTGRATSIDDVDLNLFTGSFALKNVRVAERQGPEAFLELERIEGRLSLAVARCASTCASAGWRSQHRWCGSCAPDRPSSTSPTFWPSSHRPIPRQKPSRWSVTIDRLELRRGRVAALDRAVSPAADWSMGDLAVDLSGATTRAGRPPGRADLRARLGAATLRVESPAFRLAPVDVVQKVTLAGLRPRPHPPVRAARDPRHCRRAGRWRARSRSTGRTPPSGAPRQTVSGEVAAEGLALVQRREPLRFATVGRAAPCASRRPICSAATWCSPASTSTRPSYASCAGATGASTFSRTVAGAAAAERGRVPMLGRQARRRRPWSPAGR